MIILSIRNLKHIIITFLIIFIGNINLFAEVRVGIELANFIKCYQENIDFNFILTDGSNHNNLFLSKNKIYLYYSALYSYNLTDRSNTFKPHQESVNIKLKNHKLLNNKYELEIIWTKFDENFTTMTKLESSLKKLKANYSKPFKVIKTIKIKPSQYSKDETITRDFIAKAKKYTANKGFVINKNYRLSVPDNNYDSFVASPECGVDYISYFMDKNNFNANDISQPFNLMVTKDNLYFIDTGSINFPLVLIRKKEVKPYGRWNVQITHIIKKKKLFGLRTEKNRKIIFNNNFTIYNGKDFYSIMAKVIKSIKKDEYNSAKQELKNAQTFFPELTEIKDCENYIDQLFQKNKK